MRFTRKRGATSVKVRVFIPDNSVATGAGCTGLSSASTNLAISYSRENDNGATEVTGANILDITTIGTWQDPTAGKVRFKAVDAAKMPGVYEIHFADSAAFGTGDTSQNIICNIYEKTSTALKIGPNMVMIPLSSRNVLDGESDLVAILGTALTETAGQIAAAFIKFFNKATPTGTINSLPDAVPGAVSALPINNASNAYTPKDIYDKVSGLTFTAAGKVDANTLAVSGTTQTAGDIPAKLLKYVQLLARKDAAIATDNATELTAINANGGSGAGAFSNQTDAEEALRDRGDAAWITATGFATPTNITAASGVALAADQAVNVTKVNGTAQSAGDLKALIDTIDTVVDAIKDVTDKLGYTGAGPYYVNAQVKGRDNLDFGALEKTSLNAATPAASVGVGGIQSTSFAAGAIDAAAVAADLGTELATALLDLANAIDTGVTPRGALRIAAATGGGQLSGAGTATETLKNPAGTKSRVIASVDGSGNRTAITLDLT
jgi:hypothetical protein